jgi:cytochrome c biogenesis protein
MTGLRAPSGARHPDGPAAQRQEQAAVQRPEQPATAAGRRAGAAGPGPFGAMGWMRWAWRQLTSMRTALVLLFLLAVGSVPGSVLPQQGIDPQAVQQYYLSHPSLAPLLARLWLFNVFAAPWFAAIYLLLFLSLAGCVVPRTFRLARSARALPPPAPRNLARLPNSARYQTRLAPGEALDGAAALLAARRFRLRTGDGWLSAEKGYRREVGNLLFHLALLAILGAVALGGLFGYKADRLLVAGSSFANTATALDEFHPGRAVSAADLQPFSIALNRFTASYVTSGKLRGQPSAFDASIRYSAEPGSPAHRYDLRVNHPLNVDGAKVYLIGHGYAPVFKVTDGTGRVVFDQAVPFIAVEQSGLTSEGVVKVPDARPQQLGFEGVFLPTAVDAGGTAVEVAGLVRTDAGGGFDEEFDQFAEAGNLGMDSGPPQSVYDLDTTGLRRLAVPLQALAPGQSMKLPDGAGTLTFTGYRQWISLAITYDPGQGPALLAGVAALAGLLLSLFVRRRRMFVRAYPGADGGTAVEVAGLVRTDAGGGFDEEFDQFAEALRSAHGASAVPAGLPAVPAAGAPAAAVGVPAVPAAGTPAAAGGAPEAPAAGSPRADTHDASPIDTEGE